MFVNLVSGERFVNIDAVKIVHPAVIKAVEIVALVMPDYGELIVTKPACTTVPHQVVLDQTGSVVVASPGSGAYCVMKPAATVVLR
jgi:hypothetical protein